MTCFTSIYVSIKQFFVELVKIFIQKKSVYYNFHLNEVCLGDLQIFPFATAIHSFKLVETRGLAQCGLVYLYSDAATS